jgi:hypothetical protein
MVLSLSAVAFADTSSEVAASEADKKATINTNTIVYNAVGDVTADTMYDEDGKVITSVAYGDTAYFKLTDGADDPKDITSAASVAKLNVSAKWTKGADVVKSVEIVKKSGAYYVAVATTGSSLSSTNVVGKISLKGKTGTGSSEETLKGKDGSFEVDFDVKYPSKDATGDELTATTKTVYDFSDVDETEYTINFGDNDAVAVAVVSVKNTGKVLLGCDTDDIAEIVDAYPDAKIKCVALTGTFKKTAELTIYADEDTYLYEVVDGKVKAVDAEYDDDEGGFVLNTKVLGTYLISNTELDLSAADEGSVVVDDTVAANPSTGAAA